MPPILMRPNLRGHRLAAHDLAFPLAPLHPAQGSLAPTPGCTVSGCWDVHMEDGRPRRTMKKVSIETNFWVVSRAAGGGFTHDVAGIPRPLPTAPFCPAPPTSCLSDAFARCVRRGARPAVPVGAPHATSVRQGHGCVVAIDPVPKAPQ